MICQFPNMIGFVLGVVQMVLYMVFKNYNKKNIDFEQKRPTSISTIEAHLPCDAPKHESLKDTDTNNQAITIKSTHEEDDIETHVEEPPMICTIQPINDLIEDVMKEDMILKASTGCSSIIQPINAVKDHNQTKNLEPVPNQVYLIESAA